MRELAPPQAARGVAYGRSEEAQRQMYVELRGLVEAGARRICDVGGGASPVLPRELVDRHGLEYLVVDESQAELDKAPADIRTRRLDVCDPGSVGALLAEEEPFDLVVSKWTAEHVPDGRAFHSQVFDLLRPGGAAVHLFPTLFSPVFVLNRVLPAGLSARLLASGSEGREAAGAHGKFRPFYSWCRGPSRRQLRRLEAAGFGVEAYVGYFGHWYYARARPLHRAHRGLTELLLRHPRPSLTSYALVVLRRKEVSPAAGRRP